MNALLRIQDSFFFVSAIDVIHMIYVNFKFSVGNNMTNLFCFKIIIEYNIKKTSKRAFDNQILYGVVLNRLNLLKSRKTLNLLQLKNKNDQNYQLSKFGLMNMKFHVFQGFRLVRLP